MNRFFAMLRYDKKLLWFFIVGLIDLVILLGFVLFDVTQLILISKNSAKISSAFVGVNIAFIVFVSLNLAALITFFVIRKLKEEKYELEKD